MSGPRRANPRPRFPYGLGLSARSQAAAALTKLLLLLGGVTVGCSSEAIPEGPAVDVLRFNTDGVQLLAAGDLERAEARFLRALVLAESTDNVEGKAESLYNLGTLHRVRGRPEDALAELRLSEAIFAEVGRRDGAVRALAVQGGIHLDEGNLEVARACLDRALAEAPAGIAAEVLTAVAALRLRQGDPAGAREAAEQALACARTEDARADALFGLARIEALAAGEAGGAGETGEGRVAEARRLLREALEIDRALDRRLQMAETLQLLGELAASDGRAAEAARYFERAAGVYAGLKGSVGTGAEPAGTGTMSGNEGASSQGAPNGIDTGVPSK